MKRIRSTPLAALIAAVALTAVVSAPAHGADGAEAGSPADDVGARLDDYVSRLAGYGYAGAVLVSRDGHVLIQRGAGIADRERGRPMRADTVFTVGSITKQFTAAAILRLEASGRLRTSDSIDRYFDDVPGDKRAITLHHLLTHSSGLPPALGDDGDVTATREWIVRHALDAPLLFAPGSGYEYSNVGYSLLAAIVEIVSGQPYESYLRKELFEPAGMKETGYLAPAYPPQRLAIGYRDGERRGTVLDLPMLDDGPSWNLRGNGGIHSTVGDMARWIRALDDDTVLPADARHRMIEPYVDEGGGRSYYGYGWVVMTTPRGTRLVTHNGGNGVFSADVRRYVDENVFIIGFSNDPAFIADRVTEALARIVFGGEVDLPPRVRDPDPVLSAAALGRYGEGPSAVDVTAAGSGLLLSASGERAEALLGGGGEPPAGATAVAARLLDAARSASAGNYAPLHEAFGGGMPIERIAEMEGHLEADNRQRLGAPVSVELARVRAGREGLQIFVRKRYARGAMLQRFDVEAGRIVGVELPDELPPTDVVVRPVGDAEFRSWSPDGGASVTVTLERSDDGTVKALLVGANAGPVRLARSGD